MLAITMDASLPLLVIIAGPTGSGKSELALRLGESLGGEVVNCDSIQLYRHFDIGAAKLPAGERRRIPHHLIDVANPDQTFTAGDYQRLGRAVLAGIAARGRIPIVAGGTGFYLRALVEGLVEASGRNPRLRARLERIERKRPGTLHRWLEKRDPPSALRIHANDTKKLTRALEMIVDSGLPLTTLYTRNRGRLEGFRIAGAGLNPHREELYRRLDERVERMFSAGLVDEVRRILGLGYAPHCKPFESLGYAQALRCVQGASSLEQAIAETKLETRRYAKRQWTWFRRQASLEWFEGFGGDAGVQRAAGLFVRSLL